MRQTDTYRTSEFDTVAERDECFRESKVAFVYVLLVHCRITVECKAKLAFAPGGAIGFAFRTTVQFHLLIYFTFSAKQ